MARRHRKPRCIIIAGPHGAGKTTFARDYLPGIASLIHFINADLIACGISPLRPELAAIAAGRLVLRELSRLVEAKAEFAFESTLSGLHYAKRLEEVLVHLRTTVSIRPLKRFGSLSSATKNGLK
jgi:predicted ABC-type ATPase